MITDLFLELFGGIGSWLVDVLPAGDPPALPGASTVADVVAKVDSLLPISSLMQAAAGVLAALIGFITVRLVLVVRHTILP